MLLAPGRLGPRFACPAIGGSSDFVHYSQSRQSHKAVSSLCRGRCFAHSSTDDLFTSSCSPRPVAGTQLLLVFWREALFSASVATRTSIDRRRSADLQFCAK